MPGENENMSESTCDPNVCQPIESYEDVLKFKNCCPPWGNTVNPWTSNITTFCLQGSEFKCHSFSSELHKRHKLRSGVPKTLFCHDLKGGYLEDRFVSGSAVHDEYRYFHWAVIDTFVYFSHHLVTIPPPMWIDAGHLHGTKVLGTLITEWKEGEEVWHNILKNEKSVEEFVDCLVSICCNFGFDGYLLNVENIIDAEKITLLELFVGMLHSKLHDKLSHCEVIWYDSVTKDGKLEWQNELNELNRIFFNNCDGIFLNYTWKENNLEKSAGNAGSRLFDVYVGVDVFGRNCYSGGGFNTCKALEVVRKQNLSVALFAPSWVHEYLGRTCFTHMEYAFWQKLWPYLYVHGPTQLPFSTSFCQGYGKKLYHNGNVISATPWYNLSKQQYQPTVSSCLDDSFVEPIVTARALQDVKPESELDKHPVSTEAAKKVSQEEEEREIKAPKEERINEDDKENKGREQTEMSIDYAGCIQHYVEDAFNGGGCLKIQKQSNPSHQKLMLCNFHCTGATEVTVATKPVDEDKAVLNILLLLEHGDDDDKDTRYIVLAGKERAEKKEIPTGEFYPITQNIGETPACSGWMKRTYKFTAAGNILQICVEVIDGNSVLLGWLEITQEEEVSNSGMRNN